MTCQPPLLQIVRCDYAPPRGLHTPFEQLLAFAWKAVNLHMPPHRNNTIDGLYRYHVELWATGPECLLSKSRLRQICLARALCCITFRKGKKWGANAPGKCLAVWITQPRCIGRGILTLS